MAKTLEKLENSFWGEPEFDSSLVVRCHSLRKKPIDQFTVGDLRIMLGQDIGTQHLMPRALGILESNPLAEGDLYEGDLLGSMLKLPQAFWDSNPDYFQRALAISKNALLKIEAINRALLEKEMKRVEDVRSQFGANLNPEVREHYQYIAALVNSFMNTNGAV